MKIGYKGFDKSLQCKDKFQYKIGEIYSKPNIEDPEPCTADGFHYCNKLENVFEYYPGFGGDSDRYCEIEILGNFKDEYDGKKSITTAIRIIRELSKEEVINYKYQKNLKLDVVKLIQQKYPHVIVGGSVSLFLHGIRLERYLDQEISDIDMITPYFTLFKSSDGFNVEYVEEKSSGNDFDHVFTCNGTKVDFRIDPNERYELVEFDGFEYKVIPLEVTIEAKARYAMKSGGVKHRNDIREMCGLATTITGKEMDIDDWVELSQKPKKVYS